MIANASIRGVRLLFQMDFRWCHLGCVYAQGEGQIPGGLLVMRSGGGGIVYSHTETYFGDHPPMADVSFLQLLHGFKADEQRASARRAVSHWDPQRTLYDTHMPDPPRTLRRVKQVKNRPWCKANRREMDTRILAGFLRWGANASRGEGMHKCLSSPALSTRMYFRRTGIHIWLVHHMYDLQTTLQSHRNVLCRLHTSMQVPHH